MLITIFDTETTNLPGSRYLTNDTLRLWPHVVQFSYIVYDTDEKKTVAVRDFIIKLPPGVLITKESSDIHGITHEITEEKGVEINGVLAEFMDWCNKSELIVGHNVEFDYNMVCAELMRLKNDEFKDYLEEFKNYKKFFCTMKTTVYICKIKKISQQGKE